MQEWDFETHNWVSDQGGLPQFVHRIMKHLAEKNPGWDKSRVVSTAIATIKRLCAGDSSLPGKQNINPKSQAVACAALAQWESMKAKARADNAVHPVGTGSGTMSSDNVNADIDVELEGDLDDWEELQALGEAEVETSSQRSGPDGWATWARDLLSSDPALMAKLQNLE